MADKGWNELEPYFGPALNASAYSADWTLHKGRVYLRGPGLSWPLNTRLMLQGLPEKLRPETPQKVEFGGYNDLDLWGWDPKQWDAYVNPDGTMIATKASDEGRIWAATNGSTVYLERVSWVVDPSKTDDVPEDAWQDMSFPTGEWIRLEPPQYAVHDNIVHFRGKVKWHNEYFISVDNTDPTMDIPLFTGIPSPPRVSGIDPRVNEERFGVDFWRDEDAVWGSYPFFVTFDPRVGHVLVRTSHRVHTMDVVFDLSQLHWHWPLWKAGIMCLV